MPLLGTSNRGGLSSGNDGSVFRTATKGSSKNKGTSRDTRSVIRSRKRDEKVLTSSRPTEPRRPTARRLTSSRGAPKQSPRVAQYMKTPRSSRTSGVTTADATNTKSTNNTKKKKRRRPSAYETIQQLRDTPVPSGWRPEVSETFFVFWVNDNKEQTQWTDPRFPLPSSDQVIWKEKRDETGKRCFVNSENRLTYEDPRGKFVADYLSSFDLPLPSTLEMMVDSRGFIYFVDHLRKETVWNDPRNPLPVAWKLKRRPDGVSYFYNRVTRQETFRDPRCKLSDGWCVKMELRGLYYLNPQGVASWVDPRDPLPENWSLEITAEGKLLFSNLATEEKTEQDPRLLAPSCPSKTMLSSSSSSSSSSVLSKSNSKSKSKSKSKSRSSTSTDSKTPSYLTTPRNRRKKPSSSSSSATADETKGIIGCKRRSWQTEYISKGKIDRGGFGIIHQVQRHTDGEVFAMKLMSLSKTKTDLTARRIIMNELKIHSSPVLKHDHIVSFQDSFVTEKSAALIMEFCDGGSLYSLIEARKEQGRLLPEDLIMRWFIQICLGMCHLHSHRTLHLDLKSANVLLQTVHQGRMFSVRLCDFGNSSNIDQLNRQINVKDYFRGSPGYASPEVLKGEVPDWKADVWAAGVILYQLITLDLPFGDAGAVDAEFRKVRQAAQTKSVKKIPNVYSKELQSLVDKLLSKKPKYRPHFIDILQSPFVNSHVLRMLAEDEEFKQTTIMDEEEEEKKNPSQIVKIETVAEAEAESKAYAQDNTVAAAAEEVLTNSTAPLQQPTSCEKHDTTSTQQDIDTSTGLKKEGKKESESDDEYEESFLSSPKNVVDQDNSIEEAVTAAGSSPPTQDVHNQNQTIIEEI